MSDETYDVLIIGGGLAGLTAAIHLSGAGRKVMVVEKATYPHHKVCGEYLSNEINPYLDSLGIHLPGAIPISQFQLSTAKGRSLKSRLPLGGKGISRYTLDYLLFRKALEKGALVTRDSVNFIEYSGGGFKVGTKTGNPLKGRIIIGAYGKRSQLDRHLERPFIKNKSPWLAVKGHYSLKDFPDDLVALHTFDGGYAGLSRTESGAVNFCYLAHYKSFTKSKDINTFTMKTVGANPLLGEFLKAATPVFQQPLSIAQLSFTKKPAVDRNILMCGDSAGLIHPLCGNGMAMAIHSAKIASELILVHLQKKSLDLKKLHQEYQAEWHRNFADRLRAGRLIQSLLMKPVLAERLVGMAVRSPWMLQQLIRRTHGQPIDI